MQLLHQQSCVQLHGAVARNAKCSRASRGTSISVVLHADIAGRLVLNHLDLCSDCTKLVLVPPTIKTPLDEKSPYYGYQNVAYWLGSEKKFLLHMGDKLPMGRAFATVFQNTSKSRWDHVLLFGGRGDKESAMALRQWPPAEEVLAGWAHLPKPEPEPEKRVSRKRKPAFTQEVRHGHNTACDCLVAFVCE